MYEAGVNIKAMQLGHADAEMTLQIYTDATKDLKKSEMINFGIISKHRKRSNKQIQINIYDQLTTELRPFITKCKE